MSLDADLNPEIDPENPHWGLLVPLNSGLFPNVLKINGVFTIGRAQSCNLVLADDKISGLHATLYQEEKISWIKDNSSNGTTVQKTQTTRNLKKGEKLLLEHGDYITFAHQKLKYTFIFHIAASRKTEELAEYVLGKELGRGAFAVVKKATSRETGQEVAVKIIEKSRLSEESKTWLDREISILRAASHPNIVQLLRVLEENDSIYLVMEYIRGGELFTHINEHGPMPESAAKPLFLQLVSALRYLHGLDICHRDLKPENVLFANPEKTVVKLTDFGFSRVADGIEKKQGFKKMKLMFTQLGTPEYVAPEVLLGQGGYTQVLIGQP